jgi:hypothetical protein
MALQRTRRPRFRSGRSLRSLGSPLNARPLAGPQAVLSSLALAALALPGCHTHWRNADRFQADLKCNQSLSEVADLARKNGAADITAVRERYRFSPTHILREKSTAFDFWFNDKGLESFRQGKYYGITGLKLSVTLNLCTGKRTGFPMLRVDAPQSLKGASVFLDGSKLGGLSTGEGDTGASIGIPVLEFGEHELRVTKDGFVPVTRRFTYEPKNFWPEQESIHIVVSADEARPAG